jgi:medium-chain acyl-[acyl-carrier-protein] hydrolase
MSELESNPWLSGVRVRTPGRLRLFCFPYAGAGTPVFSSWTDELPAWVQVCPVQYPGRGPRMREPAFRTIAPLVHAMLAGMADCFDRPFAFFGHSMGALVAFELTHVLRDRFGVQPIVLVLSGCRAPQIPPREPPTYNLPDDEFVEALRVLNGTPPELLANRDCLDVLLPILRADFEAVQTYVSGPKRKLAVPIVAFGGAEDSEVLCDDLEAWRDVTLAPFTRETLSGGHFFLTTSQQALLARVRTVLARTAPALAGL